MLLGTDWIANRDSVLARIGEDTAAGRGNRILMVPELISHDTERRLAKAAGDRSSRYAQVLSFTRLARRVAEWEGCAIPACLDDGGRVAAMAATTRALHSKLKAWAAVETRPEFLTGLVDAVDEFKRCCVTSQDLKAAAAQTSGSLAQKLEELALILEGYDSLCAQGKRDPRDQMRWLLEQMEAGSFARSHVFYIDGFPDFTRQHLAILEHLIREAPEVTVSLNCDVPGSRSLAFEKAGQTARQILRMAEAAGIPAEVRQIAPRQTPLAELGRQLYQGPIARENLDSRVTALRMGSVYQECVAAAERVLALLRAGNRCRDISVVCAEPQGYRDTLNLVFHRCHIPIYQSGTEDILEKGAMNTVLRALDAALGGFDQRQMLRYLRTVFSPLDSDTCDYVENYVLLWDIRGNDWIRPWKNHPDGLGQDWSAQAETRLAELNTARAAVAEPLERLRGGIRQGRNLKAQVQALYAFLEEISMAPRLARLAQEMDAAGDNRSAQELNQLWEILLGALEQLYDTLGETVWDGETFPRLLRLLLSQYSVGTIPTVLDAVAVGPVSAMRCQQEKHLLVLGAVEGNLPAYTGACGILSDGERGILRQIGVPLTGGGLEGVQAEFGEIYGVFTGAEETVYVSCPEGQPSFLYRRLAEMAGGGESPQRQLGAALAEPLEAAAWLVGQGDRGAAQALGLEAEYDSIRTRIAFRPGTVSPEGVQGMYGRKLRLSASQVDCLAECRMAYFLKYGLKARERKKATVDPAEFGTYVHAVLENTVREVMTLGGFREVCLERTMEIARKHSDAYAAQRFAQLESQRAAYLLRRNSRELEMVVEELWRELQASEFQPAGFEVHFGEGGQMEPVQIPGGALPAELVGFVDRVDTWQGPEGSCFRVVDYKTGKKEFDNCDILTGVGLQMLLYLFALEDGGEAVAGRHPVAAGVQYFPARVPVLGADGHLTAEEAALQRRAEQKKMGLVVEDGRILEAMEPGQKLEVWRKRFSLAQPGQLPLLRRYVFGMLRDLVGQIASGRVDANPYTRGTAHNACAYCPYGTICREEKETGRRDRKKVEDPQFWKTIQEEENPHG